MSDENVEVVEVVEDVGVERLRQHVLHYPPPTGPGFESHKEGGGGAVQQG